jgi:hypothetical protein
MRASNKARGVQSTNRLAEMVRDLEGKNRDLQQRLGASKGLRDALAVAQAKVAETELLRQEMALSQGEARALQSKVREMEGRVTEAEEARARAAVRTEAEICAGRQAAEHAKARLLLSSRLI